jgi:hypothetical protein
MAKAGALLLTERVRGVTTTTRILPAWVPLLYNDRMNKTFLLIFIAVVFILGGLLYIYNPDSVEYKNSNEKEPVACTMEAKLCPDGSYVGRTGPNCEFICPATSTPIFEDGTINQ